MPNCPLDNTVLTNIETNFPWKKYSCSACRTVFISTGTQLIPVSSITESSFIVAASNASEDLKAQAVYICDGVADDEEINEVIGIAATAGKPVTFVGTDFYINSSILPQDSSVIVGEGMYTTKIHVAASVNTLLSANAAAGQPTIQVASTMGFKAGQTVILDADGVDDVEYIILSVGASTITFTKNIKFAVSVVANAHVWTALNAIWVNNVDNVLISDLEIDGNKANQGAAGTHGVIRNGIATYDLVDGLKIRNVYVHDSYMQGILLFGADNSVLENIRCLDCGDPVGSAGLSLHWYMGATWGDGGTYGTLGGTGTDHQGNNNVITNIISKNSSTFGIYNSGMKGTVINNAYIDGLTGSAPVAGMVVYKGDAALGSPFTMLKNFVIKNVPQGLRCYSGNCDDSVYENFVIDTTTGIGIYVYQDKRVRILNPYIKDATSHGIYAFCTQDIEIVNPTIISGGADGIRIMGEAADYASGKIVGGVIESNGTYGIRFYDLVRDFVIDRVVVRTNQSTGIAVGDHCTATVSSCIAYNNNQSNSFMVGGIGISGQHCIVVGNICFDNQGAKTQDVGISEATTGANNIITGNICYGNADAGLWINGTDSVAFEQRSEVFMDILANTANHVVAAADLTQVTPIACVIANQPDVPRNVTIAITDGDVSISAFTITVQGRNAKGYPVSEVFAFAGGLTQTGNAAYSVISYITVNSITGAGAGDVLNIGIGSKLGLSFPVSGVDVVPSNWVTYSAGVFKVKKNNAHYTPASYTVNYTYDTVDVSTGGAIVGGDDFTIWYMAELNRTTS